jgi:hypothetical protein
MAAGQKKSKMIILPCAMRERMTRRDHPVFEGKVYGKGKSKSNNMDK